MPDARTQLSQPKLLIGEGREDVFFFTALLKQLNLNDVQIAEYHGTPGLRPYVRNLHVRPNFAQLVSLGIVRDADADATSGLTI